MVIITCHDQWLCMSHLSPYTSTNTLLLPSQTYKAPFSVEDVAQEEKAGGQVQQVNNV